LRAFLHGRRDFSHAVVAGGQPDNPFDRHHPVEQCQHCCREGEHQTFIHRFISLKNTNCIAAEAP
jgi:hypothetical protein